MLTQAAGKEQESGTSETLPRRHGDTEKLAQSHDLAQFQYLYVWRTVFPVVPPADDQVALDGIMAVLFELEAFIFKLNAEVLPAAGLNLNLGLAVGKPCLHVLNDKAQPLGHHA